MGMSPEESRIASIWGLKYNFARQKGAQEFCCSHRVRCISVAHKRESKAGRHRLCATPTRETPFGDIEQLIQDDSQYRHGNDAGEHLRICEQRPCIHDKVAQSR